MDGFAKFMIAILVGLLIFSFFGMYMSVKQASKRSQRCEEISGYRVSGKYNGSLCRVNGVIVDVDYDDYLQQAENARSAR